MTSAEKLAAALKDRKNLVPEAERYDRPEPGKPVIGYGSAAGPTIVRLKAELRSAYALAKALEKEAEKFRVDLTVALTRSAFVESTLLMKLRAKIEALEAENERLRADGPREAPMPKLVFAWKRLEELEAENEQLRNTSTKGTA
jgi:hypothetical protein